MTTRRPSTSEELPRHHARLPRAYSADLDEPFDRATEDRMWNRIRVRSARPPRTSTPSLAAGALVGVALVALVAARWGATSAPARALDPVPSHALRDPDGAATRSFGAVTFADGSSVTGSPRPELLGNGLLGVRVRQSSGVVTYDTPATRHWTVVAPGVTVSFLDASVSVDRRSDRTIVSVSRGEAELHGPRIASGVARLQAGMLLSVFDVEGAPSTPTALASLDDEASASTGSSPPPPDARRPRWRQLEAEGQHVSAYLALGPGGIQGAARSASLDELFALADVARLSAHPSEAVGPLQSIVSDHASDSRAALAAFTLGRVELDDLGDPRAAAAAFQRAIELHLPGGLDGDARVRLVEALAKSGDRTGARTAYDAARANHPSPGQDAAMKKWISDP